ncbi:ABC transporter permease [Candidatus Zixiibacteriota bacterium]
MTLRDLAAISVGNLWRMKLRSFLTVSGVVIAIAAFVAMVSFGAGNQRNVTEQFNELGLFNTMQVFPRKVEEPVDSNKAAILDKTAVKTLAGLPGVNLAYPFDAFKVTAVVLDTQVSTDAQALPVSAAHTKVFSRLAAGSIFAADSAREAVVTNHLLKQLGIENADSVIGKQLVVSVYAASIDSGMEHVLQGGIETARQRLREVDVDSLSNREYLWALARRELNDGMKRFVDGYLNARAVITDTLTICGVLKTTEGRLRAAPIIVPMATASRFSAAGPGENPIDLFSSLQRGELFTSGVNVSSKSFPKVTLDLDPQVPYATIRDTVEALGFRTFSFAEQFEQIQRFFVYFNLGLGIVGLIALITASLGIINTMVMSIIERTREIGVLKSLGANERDIKFLFLVESGTIGLIGSTCGIIFGWLITRLVSFVARTIMVRQGIDAIELFALPLWLIGIALSFGILVSLVAGAYPAARAARVDPVEALRSD